MRNWQKNDFLDDANKLSEKEQRLGALTSRNKSQLMLAATLSLSKRTISPQTKIRQRNGFVTSLTVPDCTEAKKETAFDNRCGYDK